MAYIYFINFGIYGMTVYNYGTIVRYRYPFILLLFFSVIIIFIIIMKTISILGATSFVSISFIEFIQKYNEIELKLLCREKKN